MVAVIINLLAIGKYLPPDTRNDILNKILLIHTNTFQFQKETPNHYITYYTTVNQKKKKNGIFLDQSVFSFPPFFLTVSTGDLVWILTNDTVYRFLSVTPYGHLRRCLAVCEEATLVKHREGLAKRLFARADPS